MYFGFWVFNMRLDFACSLDGSLGLHRSSSFDAGMTLDAETLYGLQKLKVLNLGGNGIADAGAIRQLGVQRDDLMPACTDLCHAY